MVKGLDILTSWATVGLPRSLSLDRVYKTCLFDVCIIGRSLLLRLSISEPTETYDGCRPCHCAASNGSARGILWESITRAIQYERIKCWLFLPKIWKGLCYLIWRGSIFSWGTMLQAGRSLVRFPMRLLIFFSIYLFLATDPEVRVRFQADRADLVTSTLFDKVDTNFADKRLSPSLYSSLSRTKATEL
jgi:hypothetical protein